VSVVRGSDESNGGEWKFFDREGKQIISNFDNITDVKKLD